MAGMSRTGAHGPARSAGPAGSAGSPEPVRSTGGGRAAMGARDAGCAGRRS
jgi:hypothetical protein